MKDSPVLVLHDTTEFSYHRDDPEAVGILQKLASPYAHGGQPGHHISCGILMHSSLVVTTDGLPLGLAAIKFWSRDKFMARTRSSAASTLHASRSNRKRVIAGLRT
jgi:hypothetical protein